MSSTYQLCGSLSVVRVAHLHNTFIDCTLTIQDIIDIKSTVAQWQSVKCKLNQKSWATCWGMSAWFPTRKMGRHKTGVSNQCWGNSTRKTNDEFISKREIKVDMWAYLPLDHLWQPADISNATAVTARFEQRKVWELTWWKNIWKHNGQQRRSKRGTCIINNASGNRCC